MSCEHGEDVLEYEPLCSNGFCDIKESDLERLFVIPFPASKTRNGLYNGFRDWLRNIRVIPVSLEIWIDGSFVTKKPDPSDIDIVCVYDGDEINALNDNDYNQLDALLWPDAVKTRYGCHVFPILKGHTGCYDLWIKNFGHSRKGEPKGMYRIFLGA